jgi:deoxyribose-phosphate aldolase
MSRDGNQPSDKSDENLRAEIRALIDVVGAKLGTDITRTRALNPSTYHRASLKVTLTTKYGYAHLRMNRTKTSTGSSGNTATMEQSKALKVMLI